MTDDRTQALVSGVLDRVRAGLQDELARLLDELRAQAAEEREEARTQARAEAEAAAAALISNAIAAERAALDDRVREAREQAHAEVETRLRAEARQTADAQAAERQAGIERAERLLASVRALDGADSLTEALDALTAAARSEAGRAAVFLVRDSELRGWAHAGFDTSVPAARALVWPLTDAGLLSKAVTERRVVDTTRGAQAPEPLAFDSADRAGLAAPLLVGGRAVAVLYVDDAGQSDAREVPSAWPEHVELLARHASRCLEALTARGAMNARAGRPVASPLNGEAAHPPVSPDEDSSEEAESARRYARLLISEIRLYNEATVEAGQKARDLLARLKPQIDRARRLYEERVPASARARADFFGQELIRTLANGDAALLGQGT